MIDEDFLTDQDLLDGFDSLQDLQETLEMLEGTDAIMLLSHLINYQ